MYHVLLEQELIEQLVHVEQHIAEGEMDVFRERVRLGRLGQAGRDTALSCSRLGAFQAMLSLHYSHHAGILGENAHRPRQRNHGGSHV